MKKAQILLPILMVVFQAVSNADEPLSISVERLGSGPIITPDMDSRMGGNIQGPSLIKVPDWVENPLGEYYLYFADHHGTYIRMAYADEVTGSLDYSLTRFVNTRRILLPDHLPALFSCTGENCTSVCPHCLSGRTRKRRFRADSNVLPRKGRRSSIHTRSSFQ